jgi:hypothetical protein
MAWPSDQERQRGLLLAELQDSEHGLFTILYDRPFTREAFLRRLQTEFDRRGWRLIKVALTEERLASTLTNALRDLPAKAAIVRMEGVYLPRFRALNMEREALYALSTNILFVFSQEAYSGFLASAHDLVTWMAPPYFFALPETGVPDLPAPAVGTRQELVDRIQYLREQVQAALEDDRLQVAFSLLPALADLYLAADMYDAAHQVYRALTLHYERAADGRQVALFAQRRDVAQGWRILADLGAGRSLVPKDRAVMKGLLDDKLLVIRSNGSGFVAADEMGHEKPLSAQTLAVLQALSERAATTAMPMPVEARTRLRQILVTRFSDEELRTLCFDLGIDYETLPAFGKESLARELIAHLERRGRISELIAVASYARPDVIWDNVLDSGAVKR